MRIHTIIGRLALIVIGIPLVLFEYGFAWLAEGCHAISSAARRLSIALDNWLTQ